MKQYYLGQQYRCWPKISFLRNCHPDDRKDLFLCDFLDASTSLSMTFERWVNIYIIALFFDQASVCGSYSTANLFL